MNKVDFNSKVLSVRASQQMGKKLRNSPLGTPNVLAQELVPWVPTWCFPCWVPNREQTGPSALGEIKGSVSTQFSRNQPCFLS